MAIVDLNTEKIIGCEKNSPTWWHEKGHIEFNKTERGIKYSYYVGFLMGVSIFFLSASFFINKMKYFALVSSLLMVYYYLYEEIWCWIYAIKKVKEIKNDSGSF